MRTVDGEGEVLSALRTAAARQRSVEAELLLLAAEWGLLHPSADGTQGAPDAAAHTEDGGCEPLAGPGCPGVSEYAIAEFAAALGTGTGEAKTWVGHGLELSHRLPRLWARVQEADVPVAAARQVATATIAAQPPLSREAADWVDQRVAPFVGLIGPTQLQEALDEAVQQFGLAVETDLAPARGPGRDVRVEPLAEPYVGLARVEAVMDLGDALDLEHALTEAARALGALGATGPVGSLRAAALGELARRQGALEISGGATGTELDGTPARRLDLSLHFTAAVSEDGGVDLSPTGRLDALAPVLLRQVRGWAAGTHTEVHVHPVQHAEPVSVPGAPGAACVFPWCERPASRCTQVPGVGTICAPHEAVRVRAGWSVDDLGEGRSLWTAPSGARYLRGAGPLTRPLPEE